MKLTKSKLTEAMYEPGDGRVTRKSLIGENLASAHGRLPLTYAVFGCDLHGQLQRNKSLEDNALTAIVNEVLR